MKKIAEYWYLILIGFFIVFAIGVFAFFGEGSYIAIHDNLDLFIPQYQMMKDTGTFWSRGSQVPFLGGISRDNLPAEFSLYTMLYMLLPSYTAYVTGYILKILIGMASCWLLAKDWIGTEYKAYRPLVVLSGFAYGILNLFPNFGIPFASVPLVIFLLRRIYLTASLKAACLWYVALFLYPLLSYFSYFGLFILAYLVAAVIWLSIRDRKICVSLLFSIVILSVGYICCEWRLFGQMLFSDTETIRATMAGGSLTMNEIIRELWSVWKGGMFHAESIQTWLVLPVCVIYFFILNISYLKNKNIKGIFHDVYNLVALVLVFNSIVYGIYYWESFRNIVEMICPPLTGWQFNRTIFFSPFLWYASFFLVLKRLYDSGNSWWKRYANGLALAAIAVILLSNTRYNDLYHTCYFKVFELLKGKMADQLSYEEFYSADLFEAAKEQINYQGEWSVAYGFYPAVLEYNGIATLDGYLGFYSQEYKEEFRKVIAPALEQIPESRIYFDEWGARVNLYSGNYTTVIRNTRIPKVTEDELDMDAEAFKALGGRYIFSGVEITNEDAAGVNRILELQGAEYNDSPYTLYVYEVQ